MKVRIFKKKNLLVHDINVKLAKIQKFLQTHFDDQNNIVLDNVVLNCHIGRGLGTMLGSDYPRL